MAGTGSQNIINLLPVTAEDGEVFNVHENGSVGKGQLRRYLKIMGPELDAAKGLVDALPTMIDVDATDADYLGLIAELVGVVFNREIPIPQQREEIKGAVQWYKRKGLLVGSRIHGYRISRLQTDIVEFWRNIKTSNREYGFSSDNAGAAATKFMLPGDETCFSYDYENQDVLERGPEFVSSEVTGHEAWRLVDNQEATSWKAAGVAPAYWGYQFPAAILPIRFNIKAGWGLDSFRLQWSDDGIVWEDAGDYRFGDVNEYTQHVGTATGGAQTFILGRVPAAPLPAPDVYEVTGYGALSTTLLEAVSEGDTELSLAGVGGLARHDWLEIYSPTSGRGYYQVHKIEGNFVTLETGISERSGFPVLSEVKQVNVTLKTITTDYTIDLWGGLLTLLVGQFTNNNQVFIDYTALSDKHSVEIWHQYEVNTENLVEHEYWRLYVDSTWQGDPEIHELQMFPEQFYGTFYRCERLGYFFTLGNARPGCSGQIVCNQPFLEETLQKLCNTMREAVPAGVVPVMIALDCKYPEIFNMSVVGADRRFDEIHTRNREVYGLARDNWYDIIIDRMLVSNDITRGSPPMTTSDGEYFISAWIWP